MNIGGGIDVDGDIDVDGGIDVNGKTELDITNISETLNVVGIATFASNIDANGNLDVSGHTELDNVNVSATSTFGGLVDANAGLDVSGISTFRNAVTVSSGGANITGGITGTLDNTLTLATNGIGITGSAAYNNSGAATFTVTSNATSANTALTIVARDADKNISVGGIICTGVNAGTHGIQCGSITASGDITSTGDIVAYLTSDLRLKTDINPIADALNKVKSISGNTFEWNENSNHEGQDTGVIAQEIEELGLPGLIKERDNGYFGVRYDKLIPLLIEAIKELSDKVDSLEERLNN
jgi:hypothetical protein